MTIPLTLIFKDGLPDQVVISDTLKKNVRAFASPFAANTTTYVPLAASKEGKALRRKCFRYCQEMLQEYSLQNGFGAIQNTAEPLVCSITYSDGEREDLTIDHFERLYRNDSWCKQLILVQGFVPYCSLEAGTYQRRVRVRSRIEDHASEAADQLTRSLASWVDQVYALSAEKSYAAATTTVASSSGSVNMSEGYMDWTQGRSSMDTLFSNQSRIQEAESKMAEVQKLTLRVSGDIYTLSTHPMDTTITALYRLIFHSHYQCYIIVTIELKCTYGLDHHDRVLLLSVDLATLESAEMINNSSSMNRAMKQDLKSSVESEIATTITKQLSKLLVQARRQGLDDIKSYAHFDVHRSGLVDVDALVDGLGRLGIFVLIASILDVSSLTPSHILLIVPL